MNLILYVVASGIITLPNGKKSPFSTKVPVPLSRALSDALVGSADPINTYKFLSGSDDNDPLLLWVKERTEEGFTVEWKYC
jgi:hypothetical protein